VGLCAERYAPGPQLPRNTKPVKYGESYKGFDKGFGKPKREPTFNHNFLRPAGEDAEDMQPYGAFGAEVAEQDMKPYGAFGAVVERYEAEPTDPGLGTPLPPLCKDFLNKGHCQVSPSPFLPNIIL
jgi:hypothetical protein